MTNYRSALDARSCDNFISSIIFILISLLSKLVSSTDFVNDRPVIAILAQRDYEQPEQLYIAASYVKWLEAAGARAIALREDANDTTVDSIFNQVNGLLLPGGSDTVISNATRRIWDLALKANEEGDKFPVWGTCLGFEFMVSLASDSGENTLSPNYDAENISLPLFFTHEVMTSDMFSEQEIRHIASSQNVTMNNHHRGISPDTFLSDTKLASMFKIISTNVDRNGLPFVSSIEAQNTELYPFYGVQWHPEKNNFEFSTVPGTDVPYEDINHSDAAVRVSFEMARVFVSEARKNEHVYKDVDVFPSVWTYKMELGLQFEQRFVITRKSKLRETKTNAQKQKVMKLLRGS